MKSNKFILLVLFQLCLLMAHSAKADNQSDGAVKVTRTALTGIGLENGVSRRDPSDVIKVGGLYYVWYSRGPVKTGYNATVWYATSPDGVNWTEKGQAIAKGGAGEWDEASVFTPNILVAEGKYWLFYTGISKNMKVRPDSKIGIAVSDSPDGPWQRLPNNPVLKNSDNPEDFDSHLVDDSCLMVHEGKYWLYYKGRQLGKSPHHTQMGLAIAEKPQGPYIKHEANPVIPGNHAVLAWPQGKGVAAMIGTTGPADLINTVQYAADGIHFSKTHDVVDGPRAGGAWRPEAFTDSGTGKPIQWGVEIGKHQGQELPYIHRYDVKWPKKRPNIIVIMADDLGYADVGCYGCKDIPTPHIDSLATDGARFSAGYVTGPMCGPSRAGFITGQMQSHFGWYGNPKQPLNPTHGLPTGIKTVAHWMQEQGYVTGGVGKWHMGTTNDQHPNTLGYDDWYGFLSGGHLYFPMDHPSYSGKYLTMKKPWGMRDMHHTMPVIHNHEPLEWDQYLTRELTDYGIRFIEDNRSKPFFLFMSYNAPHEYMEAPEETIAKFAPEKMTKIPGVKPQIRSIYAAMTDELDMGVGRLLEKLDQLGLAENTMVWFLSDNGGMKRTSDNRPLRGAKWDSYEGGLRVPLLVRWPGKITPGTVLDHPVTTLDIGATAVSLAGGDLSKTQLDGADITAYMTGKTVDAPHEELFWRVGRTEAEESGVLRVGDYKLIVQKNKVQLFNLKEDLSETTDLSKKQPERVQSMLARWKELDCSSKPSYFEGKETGKNAYQYADYEWLKGSPHYRAKEDQ